jgi:hypothetical protein
MAKSMTSGEAKKSGKPRLAPKVKNPHPNKPFMRESDNTRNKGKSPMAPMTGKKLSK